MNDEPTSKKQRVDDTTTADSSASTREEAAQLEERFLALERSQNELDERFLALERSHIELRRSQNKLRRSQNKLLGRVNGIVSVMSPATLFAKFETAVYEFVGQRIPTGWRSHEDEDKIKYGVSTTCMAVLEALKNNDTQNKFSWQGPNLGRRRSSSRQFPRNEVFAVIEAGLRGMTKFIEQSGASDINRLDSAERNKLVHNGKYLGSPEAHDIDGDEYETAKAEIRALQTTLQRAASAAVESTVPSAHDFTNCIQSLRQALVAKEFTINQATETYVIAELNSLPGVSPAPSTAATPSDESSSLSTAA